MIMIRVTKQYTKKQETSCRLYLKIKKKGLPEKKAPTTSLCLNKKNESTFSTWIIANTFKGHLKNLASNHVKKLSDPTKKF